MKKLTILAAMAITAVGFTSCGNSTPKEDLKTDVDTLSYAFGVQMGSNINEGLKQNNVDTAYIDEFIKGMNEAANNMDDKKKAAYYMGIMAGSQMSMGMKQQAKSLFIGDTTKTLSMDNFMAGFIASAKKGKMVMTAEQASEATMRLTQQIQKKYVDAHKKKGEEYMAKVAKEKGVKPLGDGVYYKEIKAGKGAIADSTKIVKINYEGKDVYGKTFDKGEGASLPVAGVVPGFSKALRNMPVGSKWEVYIPYTQAYGEAGNPTIHPCSALIFTIEMLGVEDMPKNAPGMGGMPVQMQ